MKRIPRLLFIVLFPCIIYSQEIDSTFVQLNRNLESAVNDQQRVDAIIKIGDYQIGKEVLRAEQHFLDALELINSKTKDETQLGIVYTKLGVVNRRKGEHVTAIDYYLKAKKLFEKNRDTTRMGGVIHNMALVYRYQKMYDKSLESFKLAIRLSEQTKDTFGTAMGYNMIGIVYRLKKKPDSAYNSYEKAKRLFTILQIEEEIVGVNANIAVLYQSQKRYDEALQLQLSNLKYYKENGVKLSAAIAYYNISSVYKKKKEYESCLQYADSSVMIAKDDGFKQILAKAYLRKSWASSKLNDFKSAYYDYRIFNRYSDSVYNIDNAKKIQALELNYEFEKEKEVLELQRAQERREKILYSILFFISLILVYLVWRSFKNKLVREKLEKEVLDGKIKISEAEVKSLVADNTMRQIFKKELISELEEEKKANPSKDVKQFLKLLTIKLQEQVRTENKVSKIYEKTETVNKIFEEKLVKLYPELSKNQRDFCLLLRLNLSIKEIASIKNITVGSVKSMRHRIRVKLDLKSSVELEQFIQSL